MYLSRKLTKAEMNYSNIEREALAIVWATQRARQFLLGRKFLLKSDHRPLEFIFNPRKELPKMTSARIVRWAIRLMAFDFDILYVKGNTIPHVDALSRLNFDQDEEENDGEELIHWVETDVLQAERLREETTQDPILNGIASRIRRNRWSNCSKAERPYKENRHKLTMDRGILCNGDLLVPPQSMRKEIIKSVHDDTHCGIIATQKRLRLEVWWPGYVRDVQDYVDKCPKCKEIKDFTPQSTHKWPSEGEPWNRVHMDHAHVNGIGLFLILVDSFSGWPEVIKVKDRKPITIQQVLRVIFSRNGVPKTLVSDNAPEFCEKDLCSWLTKIGCKPYKTPPYHPQSNGIAERMVRTVKLGLKAFDPSRETLEEFLPKLLMSYRSIPHANRTRSPSALMGRQIRSPITMSFSTNQTMWYRRNKDATTEKAYFIMQKGNNTALVATEQRTMLAHADQIREREEEEEDMDQDKNNEEIVNPQEETHEPTVSRPGVQETMDHSMDDSITSDDSSEDESRPRSPLRRTKTRIFRRSERSTKGTKPLRFREM